MAISRPFPRNCRQFINGGYSGARYVLDAAYAKDSDKYVRAFLLIQKDLHELFDYIEPSDQNLCCHSFRPHEILLRACVEVEANC
jgi:hypothetical protein